MRLPNWKFLLASCWLALTLSLSAWWMIHGLHQAKKLSEQGMPSAFELASQHRMFFWEGGFLLGIVIAGGAAIYYLVYLDQRKNFELRSFFSSFTHDLKTSLTSLRLQAEILEEDPRNAENTNLHRLLQDVVRLELQLENALILAQTKNQLILEELPLKKIVQSISMHWPNLKVQIEGDGKVQADHRALECILKNIFQNATFHGEAKNIKIQMENTVSGLKVRISDDGKGYVEPERLGRKLTRHTTRSGSGLGLFLSKDLANRMGGDLQFSSVAPKGFAAELQLSGRLS